MARDERQGTVNKFNTIISEDLSNEAITQIYNGWSRSYDQDSIDLKSNKRLQLSERLYKLFRNETLDVKVLDIGAGTGLVGEALHSKGFRNIDALEPAVDMLNVACAKGIYDKLYNEYLTTEELPIQAGTYDAVVGVGVLIPGHIPYNCFTELRRIIKTGGYLLLLTRKEFLDNKTDNAYKGRLVPFLDQQEEEGMWEKIDWLPVNDYFGQLSGPEGILITYKML